MLIRTLIRVRTTRFFPSELYVKNRCSRADGILVDMEHESEADQYKMSSLKRLKESESTLPMILVDPVHAKPNPRLKPFLECRQVRGFAFRSLEETTKEDFDGVNPQIPYTNTVYTLIWDLKEQRITHSIIAYHMINDSDIRWDSRLRTAVRGSLKNNIQPLAARSVRMQDMKSAVYEFNLLKNIGFTGVVLRNPNLIDLTNKIFS